MYLIQEFMFLYCYFIFTFMFIKMLYGIWLNNVTLYFTKIINEIYFKFIRYVKPYDDI